MGALASLIGLLLTRTGVVWSGLAVLLTAVGAVAMPVAAVAATGVSLAPIATPNPPLAVPTLSQVLPSPSLGSVLASPLPSPTLPLPSPTVPVVLGTPSPTPTGLGGAPSPAASALPAAGAAGTGSGTSGRPEGWSGDTPSSPQPPGVAIPFTTLFLRTPLDVALAVSIAVLPLLCGLWLLLFGRTWNRGRRLRDGALRLALASDLGLSPRQLDSVSTQALFKLREQTAFDELTGALRRAAGIVATEREIARARRQKRPLCVAFADVDGLKLINDSRGHAAGDQLLRSLAGALRAGLRGQDLVFRYGGDEFVCVLPDTGEEAARTKLAEIQRETAAKGVRFCVGLAELERSDDVVSLLGRADRRLYERKAKRTLVREVRRGPRSRDRDDRPIVA
jgi:diguanylate cyclase (GGDEF)-like protein